MILNKIFFRHSRGLLLLLFFVPLIFLTHSCKKVDNLSDNPLHDADFVKKFFETKTTPTTEVADLIEKLKRENERTDFVNKLPKNCGLPIWEKTTLQSSETSFNNKIARSHGPSANTEITDEVGGIIIPLTISNSDLSSIIILSEAADTFNIKCFTTNDYLYNSTHGTTIDTTKAMNELLFFFYMENFTFGTTKFYHIPANLFYKSTKIENDGTKTITIKNVEPPTANLMICICVTVYCSVCHGEDPACPLGGSWQECTCTTTGGGGCTTLYCGGGGGGTGGGGTGGGGGGTGGGGGGTGGGPCTNFANPWYSNLANPNCEDPPPPPPPNPCDAFIGSLENDATFKTYFNGLNQPNIISQSYEFGYMVTNRATNSYTLKNGNANSPEIDWASELGANTLVSGCLHSHYCPSQPDDCLSTMFSPQDVVLMAQIYLTGHARDTSNLFFGLTSSGPNPYLIKVNNTAAFRTFAQKIAGVDGKDQKKIKKFKKRYEDKFNSPDVGLTEKEFLQMLQKEGGVSGLGVYRSYSNCHNWQKLGLNSVGDVSVLNCY